MPLLCRVLVTILFLSGSLSFAGRICNESTTYIPQCDKMNCCGSMGGISYCDSSAGRYVCNNGYYSSCYCTRHAVMDLQLLQGCCLWQGGVLTVDPRTGAVVCHNGSVSEICSLQAPPQQISVW
ncbi:MULTISPECIES: hypothetical protein [unclassified Legionella]|uniref:hypothetical protein n=1 Tax=unclassified Legionella TaxID=2622702 RepID=UPI001054B2F9|nr:MULTISPECIES: hypothetical protein [unclassified Legionella]MDI9818564.1 hypothetical protein [Legionella sp. PL877]